MKGFVAATFGAVCVMAGCAAPATFGNQTWVDGNFPGANSVQARIQGTLRVNDGIVVSVDEGGYSPGLTPHVIDIEAADGSPGGITVIADDGWMSQKTADQLVRSLDYKDDEINRVVTLIGDVHDWQDAHPRPAPPPPPPPGPPFNWDWAYWAAGTGSLVGAVLFMRRRLPRWWKRRQDHRRAIAARADAQHQAWTSGDTSGLYGTYPPALLDTKEK